MNLKKLLSILLLIMMFTIAVPAFAVSHAKSGNRKFKIYSPHVTTFRDGSTSVAMLGLNYEYFFSSAFSFNSDVLVPRSIIPSLSLELGVHIYPLGKEKLKRGCVELLGGGGIFFSVGGESGIYPTCFTGLRYHITDRAGLYFTTRWVFGEFDVKPGIPFVSTGISFISFKKTKH